MTTKVSTIYYKTLEGKGELLRLPTIQSLTIPDSTSISSKPTVAGEYRNQYVATSPVKVNFVCWLEDGMYGDLQLSTNTVLDTLVYIRNNRIKFQMFTSHSEEESRFMTDLVIENISTGRSSDHFNRLIVTVNCTQVKFVNLSWKQASAVEIFGKEIFTSSDNKTLRMDFVPVDMDEYFHLNDPDANDWNKFWTGVGSSLDEASYASGYKQAPVYWQIKKAIESKIQLKPETYFYKLIEPINMTDCIGTRTYNCGCSFKSKYGGAETAYTVDLGQFNIIVTKNSVDLVSNFPMVLVVGAKTASTMHLLTDTNPLNPVGSAYDNAKIRATTSSFPFVYEFADTYPDKYSISPTFDKIEPFDDLANYLKTAPTSPDSNTFPNYVIVKDSYVYTYKIKDRYEFSVGREGVLHQYVPNGGLNLAGFELTNTSNGFTPKLSNEEFQEDFYSLFGGLSSCKVTVVVITLGTLIQVYLFSNQMFRNGVISPE